MAGDQSPGGESIFLPFIWQIRPGALAAFAADHADAVCSRRGRLGAGASLSAPPIPSRQALLHEAAATVLNKLELCSSPFQQLSAGSGQCPSHRRRTELLGGLPGVGGAHHHHHHHTGICRALAMQALHAQKTHRAGAPLAHIKTDSVEEEECHRAGINLALKAITCSSTGSHQRFGLCPPY